MINKNDFIKKYEELLKDIPVGFRKNYENEIIYNIASKYDEYDIDLILEYMDKIDELKDDKRELTNDLTWANDLIEKLENEKIKYSK